MLRIRSSKHLTGWLENREREPRKFPLPGPVAYAQTVTSPDSKNSRPGKPSIALTIAGFDPSNGAGITGDLQVFASHGLFGTSAITALTVQNTLGVSATHPVDPTVLRDTLRSLAVDLPPAGIKIGMLANAKIVREVVEFLRELPKIAKNKNVIPVVLDPVINSSSGAPLLDDEGVDLMRRELFDLVTCITPNRQELFRIGNPSGSDQNSTISDRNSVRTVMQSIAENHKSLAILTTGGDEEVAEDHLLLPNGVWHEFTSPRIETTSTHGTGCAFSSALLANLIHGKDLEESALYAKRFVENALRDAPGVGNGRGPMQLTSHF